MALGWLVCESADVDKDLYACLGLGKIAVFGNVFFFHSAVMTLHINVEDSGRSGGCGEDMYDAAVVG